MKFHTKTTSCLEHSIAMEQPKPEELLARFEELSVLEAEFEDVELEISKSLVSNALRLFYDSSSVLACRIEPQMTKRRRQ